MARWAELLPELLTLIAKRIQSYEDFFAFRGVCRSWRSIAVKQNFNDHSVSAQIPWLMSSLKDSDCRVFASLTKGGMVRSMELPEARDRRCIGTSLGWLITIAGDEVCELKLLHPLSRVQIPLPHLRELTGSCVHRAALSASPSITEDYVVMIIMDSHVHHLAFWRPGNNIWTRIVQSYVRAFHDVIYYKDHFYAIGSRGDLLLCDLDSCNARIAGQVIFGDDRLEAVNTYLVQCGGELLVVRETNKSARVFRLHSRDLRYQQEVFDLGGRSIFLGHDSAATAVAPSASARMEPDCIYLTDGGVNRYVTVLSQSGGGKGFYFSKSMPYSKVSPPIWIAPSF